ncbi:MAG: OsmC family protein [Planctomycetaceae bacterium]|nr:OsmC family protein [Planctomycetaceae bacterium]
MNAEQLKQIQAPLKTDYQEHPDHAIAELRAQGSVDFENLCCRVILQPNDGTHLVAGLHPKAGGNGSHACSGDMLLQALVTCAGVTLAAVTTAMGLNVSSADLTATGELDFRGTLGVDKSVPVGFRSIQLSFELKSEEPPEKLSKLVQLAERYCVVLQTMNQSGGNLISTAWHVG